VKIMEFVPQEQSVDNWTEMVTLSTISGSETTLSVLMGRFLGRGARDGSQECEDHAGGLLDTGIQNGYAFATWWTSCSRTSVTGRPEYAWYKAIRGNDNVYLVTWASTHKPSPASLEDRFRVMNAIIACDSRITDRKCGPLLNAWR